LVRDKGKAKWGGGAAGADPIAKASIGSSCFQSIEQIDRRYESCKSTERA